MHVGQPWGQAEYFSSSFSKAREWPFEKCQVTVSIPMSLIDVAKECLAIGLFN